MNVDSRVQRFALFLNLFIRLKILLGLYVIKAIYLFKQCTRNEHWALYSPNTLCFDVVRPISSSFSFKWFILFFHFVPYSIHWFHHIFFVLLGLDYSPCSLGFRLYFIQWIKWWWFSRSISWCNSQNYFLCVYVFVFRSHRTKNSNLEDCTYVNCVLFFYTIFSKLHCQMSIHRTVPVLLLFFTTFVRYSKTVIFCHVV